MKEYKITFEGEKIILENGKKLEDISDLINDIAQKFELVNESHGWHYNSYYIRLKTKDGKMVLKENIGD